MRKCRERIGQRTAEAAAVHGLVQHAHLDHARDHTTQRRRDRGDADTPVATVGDDHCVAAQTVALALEVAAEALRSRFLLALDEHRDTDRRLSVIRAQGGDVRENPGLVVRGAASVETSIAPGIRRMTFKSGSAIMPNSEAAARKAFT